MTNLEITIGNEKVTSMEKLERFTYKDLKTPEEARKPEDRSYWIGWQDYN